jgi:hypothetical protein
MSIVIPKELDYTNTLPTLPPGVQVLDQNLSPVNGSSYSCSTAGALIQFDLPQRGYLVPDSLYLRYKVTISNVAKSRIRGTPVFSFFQRL